VSDVPANASDESRSAPAPELTLAHLDALPTLAPIAVRLVQITLDADSTAQEVVDVLRGDQSLTAKVLAVANSSAAGARGKVATLDRAIVLLGFKTVRSVALAAKIFECFTPPRPTAIPRHFDRTRFWKHSLGVACAARRLAANHRQLQVDPEEAFVAGLLHDLGKVALDAAFPKAYERVVAQAEEAHCDVADCERALLGVDHTVAGWHLAKRWGFPRFLQDVVWLHNKPAEVLAASTDSAVLISLVQVADAFVREQHIGHSGNYAPCGATSHVAKSLGLPTLEVDGLARELFSDVAEHASLLGLDHETPEAVYLESLSRANTELERLNHELLASNQRLSAAARYFGAITHFDRQLNAQADLSTAVAAIADTALTALGRQPLVAFGVHHRRYTLELCRAGAEQWQRECTTYRLTPEVRQWLQDPGEARDATVVRAPQAIRVLLASVVPRLATGDCWLLPITHDGHITGGILFWSEHDARAEFAPETAELRAFLTSLGLALARANAQGAARRLSEDLAEGNRRLQQMQAELLRTRTLSEIAEVARGADHKLRDPLSVVLGHTQMLGRDIKDREARRKLEQIEKAVGVIGSILSALRDFAEPAPPQPAEVDLTELLTQLRDEWLERSGLPPSRLQVRLPEPAPAAERPRLLVDRGQIRAALDEVVSNAVEAVAETEGTITVRSRAGIVLPTPPPGAGVSAPTPAPRRWIEIVVEDTGAGMEPDVAEHAFDPFFPLKAAGRGLGMGLARARRSVEAHDGRIWFESRAGQGTTFYIRLPQAGSE
jgi:putative nucleotidyltransferase with HDIG domain